MPRNPNRTLSKSRVIKGIQCPKALYLATFRPELATPIGPMQQAIFDQGHQVGIEAQKRFPAGVLIDAPYTDPEGAIEQTHRAIQSGATAIFEAAFRHEGVLVRVDILHRERADSPWYLLEVKSTTKAQEQQVRDAAVQAWVLRGSGIELQ